MEKINNIDSLVFKRLVIPGIAIEMLFALITCVPVGVNLNLLTHPVGGPPAIAMQAGLIPCVILLFAYFCVAGIYTIILPYKYYKKSDSFLSSVRRFSIFSILLLLIMDLVVVAGLIEVIRWNYIDILNLPVVVGLTLLSFIMTGVFLYWTIKIYKEQHIKLFSIKTFEGVAIFGGIMLLMIGLFWILLYI